MQLRGGALQLWKCRDREVMLSGPAETGKTFAALFKLDALLWKYGGAQAILVRKTYNSLVGTAVQTYRRKVLSDPTPIVAYGGEKPQWFDYPNGSRLWVAGLDNPGKALSSERDFVLANQSEELTADDWQVLTTRATGRAGNAPYPQLIGDCNPGPPNHWIKNRAELRVIESRHEDNPSLYSVETGAWTAQGERTLAVLDALTGVRKERLRYGRWVSAEGAVYEFDSAIHLVDPFPIPREWARFRVVDFGYTNPFVCLWIAVDPDGRMYVYREWYMSEMIVSDHAAVIKRLSTGECYAATISDHDREDRETLHRCGVTTVPADKAIALGIQAVQDRLAAAGDGRPRLFVFRGALVERDEKLAGRGLPVSTEQEFDCYVYPQGANGKPVKETPVGINDHGMDCIRYAVRWADARLRARGSLAQLRETPSKDARAMAANAPDGVFNS